MAAQKKCGKCGGDGMHLRGICFKCGGTGTVADQTPVEKFEARIASLTYTDGADLLAADLALIHTTRNFTVADKDRLGAVIAALRPTLKDLEAERQAQIAASDARRKARRAAQA